MLRLSLLVGICLVVALAQATSYQLQDDYSVDFFDKFTFWTEADPTLGYTDYLDYQNATDSGLIKSTNPPKWGVDDNNALDPSNLAGRASVRMTSKNLYNHGLFVLDLAHMPSSTCGVWPAFWTFGQTASWPTSGEIDIIEFVNKQPNNLMTLHTNDGCSINADTSLMTGRLASVDNNCAVSQGSGCTINATNAYSAGTGFNSRYGGVYAMEWTSDFIKVWFFPAGYVPATIKNGSPDPGTDFGEPIALFQGSCDIDSHFYDHAIVFDLTFCGAWAGDTYEQDGCALSPGLDSKSSCIKYVAENPSAFKNAYWEVNSLKVYQAGSASSSVVARSTSVSSSSIASSSSTVKSSTSSVAATFSATSSVAATSSAVSTSSPVTSASTTVNTGVTSSAVSTSSAVASATTTSTRSKHWHGPPHQRRGRVNW